MNQATKKYLEDGLRSFASAQGVKFEHIDCTSAAKEIGLLEQIEINHPSKEVVQEIQTNFPDPQNPLQMISVPVKHVSRVFMTEEEVVADAGKRARDTMLEILKSDPKAKEAFLAELAKQSVGKKPTGGKSKPKSGKPMKPGKPCKQ